MTERPTWFTRTFTAGTPKKPTSDELARLHAKAETLTECTILAATYEDQNANAGIVRLILSQRADDAWKELDTLKAAALSLSDPGAAALSVAGGPAENGMGDDRGAPGLELTAEPSPVTLDSREARIRLELVAEQLDTAIQTLKTIADRTDYGMVWKLAREGGDFLKTVQAFARGETRMTLSPPEPRSLRVDSPGLRLVDGGPAA